MIIFLKITSLFCFMGFLVYLSFRLMCLFTVVEGRGCDRGLRHDTRGSTDQAELCPRQRRLVIRDEAKGKNASPLKTLLTRPCHTWHGLFVCLVVFNVPSTMRSFSHDTPIYCPLRRT